MGITTEQREFQKKLIEKYVRGEDEDKDKKQ
jgi:hypothetical protein